MEKIYDLLAKVDQIIGKFLGPIVEKLKLFFDSEEYTAMAAIGVFLGIVILVGLITWVKKTPKFFFFILIVLGAVVAAALLIKAP
ncbi:MAG: hypothetical protein PHX62_00715 [Bacilli bacterium]|nr:hypothetical protein [Bacilli bacterium]